MGYRPPHDNLMLRRHFVVQVQSEVMPTLCVEVSPSVAVHESFNRVSDNHEFRIVLKMLSVFPEPIKSRSNNVALPPQAIAVSRHYHQLAVDTF